MHGPLQIILTPANPAPFESWHFLVPATGQRGIIDGRLEGAVRVALSGTRRHALLVCIPWAGRLGLLPLRVLVAHPADAVQLLSVDVEAVRRRQRQAARWRSAQRRRFLLVQARTLCQLCPSDSAGFARHLPLATQFYGYLSP